VNDTDLCFTGGFPGPLKEVLGVWAEELDALFPEDRGSLCWNGKAYATHDLCELIHARGAEVLAGYTSDFYAGTPALTRNRFGKGRAYFIAARTDADFLRDFYAMALSEAGVKPLLDSPLPHGVTVQARSGGGETHLFLLNFTPEEKTVDVRGHAVRLGAFGVEVVTI
jgi:beta-galactosidase